MGAIVSTLPVSAQAERCTQNIGSSFARMRGYFYRSAKRAFEALSIGETLPTIPNDEASMDPNAISEVLPNEAETGKRELAFQFWKVWVADQVDRLAQTYTAQPDRVISDYYREESCTKDYHGRELLELLQNADDAGFEYEGPCRVEIHLSQAGLCIANTGKPFGPDGVISLLISDNSPKKTGRAKYIGNKGLGFRSILGWSPCPFILSGELRLGFDGDRASSWLDRLCSRNDEIRKRIADQVERVGPQQFIAKLSVPAILDEGGTVDGIRPCIGGFKELWDTATSLKSTGFDTVVGIPFRRPETFAEAEAQLDEIRREFLLFTHNLQSLAVTCPGGSRTWSVERDVDIMEIKSDTEPTQIWQVFEDAGTIPAEHLLEEHEKSRDYQIKIAVPVDGDTAPGYLYSFYPTQARFPYPVVAHATFELMANRQNIHNTPANRFLTSRLAQVMAEAAEVSSQDDPWQPLSIVTASSSIDRTLEEMGLPEALTQAAAERRVIPIYAGGLVKPCEAKRINGEAVDWLPTRGFGDFILPAQRSELARTIAKLNVPFIDDEAFGRRLMEQSATLSIDERAALIVGLINSGLMPRDRVPPLLIDEQGAMIPTDFRVFLPPAEDDPPSLPDWMSLRILNPDLADEIRRRTETTTRELTSLLNDYRVNPYAVTNLAEALVAQANERVRNAPESAVKYRREMVQALFGLFRADGESHKSLDVSVEVINAAGSLTNAASLYFSSDYENGLITSILYGALGRNRLIASPSELGLTGAAPNDVQNFLLWLGVADRPRIVCNHSNRSTSSGERLDPAFVVHAKNNFKYPVRTNYEELKTVSELSDTSFTSVESVECLDEILASAPPEAIVAWLALDDRVEMWRRGGDTGANVEVKVAGKSYLRKIQQSIPSFILWTLAHKPWLPTTSGQKAPPNRCMLAQSVPDELRALLPRPAFAPDNDLLVRCGIDGLALNTSLERIGIKRTFDDFPLSELYRLLLELPSIDPKGATAKSLYRAVISRPDTEIEQASPSKRRFEVEGKLWGTMDRGAGYFPVTKLYYLGTAMVPAIVQEKIPLLDLDKKQGAQKVKRVFGVNPLEGGSWTIQVTLATSHPNGQQVSDHMQDLKPFVYAFRLSSDSAATRLSRLKSLSVCVATEVEGVATIGEVTYPFQLQAKGDIVNEGETFYLATGETLHDALNDSVLMNALGEIFAETLGVERGSDFAMLCMAQPGQRKPLLARLLGVSDTEAESLLSQACSKLDSTLADEVSSPSFSPWTAAPTKDITPIAKPEVAQESNGQTIGESNPIPSHRVESIILERQEHFPLGPARKIDFRVQATPASVVVPHHTARVTDAKRCQDVIEHVELELGRFALPVSQLQGTRAYGCDFVSFRSMEARDEFQSQRENPDVNLVDRFIEVKGKNSDNSTIELRGNELVAAKRFGARYYLYRVYEQKPGEFLILTLADPISAELNEVVELTLARQSTAERYRAIEVAELSADASEQTTDNASSRS